MEIRDIYPDFDSWPELLTDIFLIEKKIFLNKGNASLCRHKKMPPSYVKYRGKVLYPKIEVEKYIKSCIRNCE